MNEHTETFDFFMPCMAGQMDTAFNKREGMEELIRMIDYITKHDPLIHILVGEMVLKFLSKKPKIFSLSALHSFFINLNKNHLFGGCIFLLHFASTWVQ